MKVVIWGDSITFGACDKDALGWVGRLRKQSFTGDENHFYNFGVCGEDSDRIQERFTAELQRIRPDVALFALGINDSKIRANSDENNVSLTDYINNIEKLIIQTEKYTKKIILISATNADSGWETHRGSRFLNEEIKKYNKALKEYANKNSFQYIDVFGVLDEEKDLDDGVHPNTQGYQKMYEKIKSELDFV